jgi:hypothetical protein
MATKLGTISKITTARASIATKFAALATQLSVTIDLPTTFEIKAAEGDPLLDKLVDLKFTLAHLIITEALELRERAN